jgi:DNA-binding CsgD family transcriptional regulator
MHTRRRDADDALIEWQSLVDGKWTLVDHFDTDGRRFLVARRNPPGGDTHASLSVDEARAAGFRAMGHPLKLIAYELGFSLATVSRLLRSAARKLGLESSQELVNLRGERDGTK